jgi:aconitate hydratase
MRLEFQRNHERYQFMKWGMQAFDTFGVVPPGLRHRPPGQPRVPGARRSQGAAARGQTPLYYPDSLVGPTATRR